MVGTERLLSDRQGALVERLRLGVVTLVLVESGQAVEAAGDIRMVGAERPLADRQGASEGRLGLGVAALAIEKGSLLVESYHLGALVRRRWAVRFDGGRSSIFIAHFDA